MEQPLEFEILGGNLQAIRFTLRKGQVVIGEAGSMLFMDDGISFECKLGDGSPANPQSQNSSGGWFKMIKTAFQRILTNESIFFTWFTNTASVPRVLAVAAPRIGTIIQVNLHELPQSTILAQGGAFLCSSAGVKLQVELVRKFGAGFFGGEGFLLQRLSSAEGYPGQLFIHAGGYITRLEIKNEELTVDCGCLMAFTLGIDYEVGVAGLKNAFVGGEMFTAKLRGTGSVWVQSLPFSKYADRIINSIPKASDDAGGGDGGGE
eukprot:CAMPEP_0197933322 /NCGR_PEP_ID=MMETSP1439-20131203/109964_1 /TAXON_ID=66791 /ORGANISM="Gonyaulax spinifera, Strain CCMP409" /LENGTH=262 /DNA_ID=CAMNT_0043556141 /DNA_START=74 /DNA_END=862 /DNA_ORIENTATION=-